MPRDGSGIYTQPLPDVVPATTIASTVYNGFVNDVETDLNAVRPIIAGGTGASNAQTALYNLGAEKAAQLVTNYDTQLWVPGSFYSASSATSAPVAGHSFAGQCYINEPLANPPTNANVVLEARDENDTTTPGRMYVREKKAGVWGAWTVMPDTTSLDATYINVTGDAMTGNLGINKTQPTLVLNKPDATTQAVIQSTTNNLNRWAVVLGSNAADDFAIARSNDAGVLQDFPLSIERANGRTTHLGDMRISKTQPVLLLDKPVDTSQCIIQSTRNGSRRFAIMLASGAGDDFELGRFNDSDVYQGPALQINRGTGNFAISSLPGAVIGITGNTTNTGTFSVTGAVNANGPATINNTFYVSGNAGFNAVPGSNPGFSGGTTGATIDSTGRIFASCATGATAYWNVNAAGFLHSFDCNSAAVGSISVSTTATAFNTSSDERLKEDLKSFDAGNVVDDTNVYDFKWKTTGERSYGILAQQAKDVYPAAVFHDDKTDWWGIDYAKYVPVLLQELKTLRARVAALEATVVA